MGKRLRRRRLLERLGLRRNEEMDVDAFASPACPEDTAAELRAVYRVLGRLSTEARLVLILRRVEGLTIEETAERMHVSMATVKRRLADADAQLSELRTVLMIKTAPLSPGQYLRPHLTETRTRQTWARIMAERPLPHLRRTPVARRWAVAPALALAACVGAVFILHHPAPRVVAGSGMTISSEAHARSFELAGAQIELQPFASVTVAPSQPFEQRLTVTHGAVRFQVAHDPLRRFVVMAGAVEVSDVGTAFTVAREGMDGDVVRVAVTTGEVEVRVGSRAPYSLHAGESLTTPEPTPTPAASTTSTGGPASEDSCRRRYRSSRRMLPPMPSIRRR